MPALRYQLLTWVGTRKISDTKLEKREPNVPSNPMTLGLTLHI